jgi:KDO2-lipid IV(A) lauroyltransferase
MNTLKALLIKGLLYVCAALPLGVARALGRGAAWLYWPCNGRSRRVTERNIQLAFPELNPEQQQRLARDSLAATAELATETGHIWLRSWDYVSSLLLDIQGAELISDAQREGRGVIVLAPHVGNWEVIGLHLGTLGSTVSLYEPPKLAALGPLIERARQRSGAVLVPTDNRGLAKLLKSVKRGQISGILPDQVPAELHAGENSPFMGIPCFTGTLASSMIRRTGALAVFGLAQRVKGGFILRYQLADKELYDEDNAISLAALNRGVETCLRHCPEQYQWEYKRFRHRPPGQPDPYRKAP